MPSGSTKSLLIFIINLRRGVPTQHRPDFPHIGGGYSSPRDILGILDPSGRVLRRVSLWCTMGNRGRFCILDQGSIDWTGLGVLGRVLTSFWLTSFALSLLSFSLNLALSFLSRSYIDISSLVLI